MFDCFSKTPNFSFRFEHQKNQIPLDEMNPIRTKLSGSTLKFHDQSIVYTFQQIDKGDDDLLNKILWFSVKGKKKYPAKLAGEENEKD
jgi:hypothetical protein